MLAQALTGPWILNWHVFGSRFYFLNPTEAPPLLFLPWFMPLFPERWDISSDSLAVCVSCCFTAMKVSFWTPVCRLLLGAKASLPSLLPVTFKKRGIQAWVFSPFQQLRAGRGFSLPAWVCSQPSPMTDTAGCEGTHSGCWLCSHVRVQLRKHTTCTGYTTQQREIWVITCSWQWYALFKLTNELVVIIPDVR